MVDELISNHNRALDFLHKKYQSARLRYLRCLINNGIIRVHFSQSPQTVDQLLRSKNISIVNKIPLTNTHRLKY